VPTITALVGVFDAKAFSCKDLLISYIAGDGENRILTATGKPTEIATIEIFDKTHGLRFLKNHICSFLSVFKKKTNALHRTYVVCVAATVNCRVNRCEV